MIAVGSMVLSSRASRNSRRSAAAASGLGGILPSGRSVSCQGSWLSAFLVDSGHRITNGACIGGSLVALCGKFWFCLSSDGPLQRLPGRLAPCVAGQHISVFPPALALHRCVERSRRHHPPRHPDAAAVPREPVAQASGPRRGTDPVGQGLAGQPEHWSCGVNIVLGQDLPQGAGGLPRSAATVAGSTWFLPFWTVMTAGAVGPKFHVAPGESGGLGTPESAVGQDPYDG